MQQLELIAENKSSTATISKEKSAYTESIKGSGERKYLFVEKYLEKPIYKGDPQMLTLPTACTFRGVPLLDDF